MVFWKLIFTICILIIFYNYIGYAIIVFVINKFSKRKRNNLVANFLPTVSFIVAAYNEEDVIEKKIVNSLAQNYPPDKIEFIFITDGSTDKTPEIVKKFTNVTLLHSEERKGKSAAVNRAISYTKNDILILNDANTVLNKDATRLIAAHYFDPKIGGVAGEKKVLQAEDDKEGVGSREGLYWKYESFLKKIDSDFYSVVGAAGELFSVRKSLYEPIPQSIILDDFVISLQVAHKDYRIVYEPDAYAMEFSSLSINDEKKRKVRIAAGGFQAMRFLVPLLQFWKHFRLTFLYLSHRVLRWFASPFCLLLIFISNFILTVSLKTSFYLFVFVMQCLFYLIAILSKYISDKSRLKPAKTIGYFVFMNMSVIQGFFRYIFKRQSASWEKVKRTSSILVSE